MDIFDMPVNHKSKLTDEEQEEKAAYMPTLEEIDRMKREIRAEREAKEVQEAITELVAEDDE